MVAAGGHLPKRVHAKPSMTSPSTVLVGVGSHPEATRASSSSSAVGS